MHALISDKLGSPWITDLVCRLPYWWLSGKLEISDYNGVWRHTPLIDNNTNKSIWGVVHSDSAKLVSPRSSTDEKVGGPAKNMRGPVKLLYITMFKIGKNCKKWIFCPVKHEKFSRCLFIGPWWNWLQSQISKFQTHFNNKYHKCFLWNCFQVNATTPHWSSVNIGSGNGLVPSGNKPLPEPMLT